MRGEGLWDHVFPNPSPPTPLLYFKNGINIEPGVTLRAVGLTAVAAAPF